MADYTNCGSHVSPDYHRVFADEEGVLAGCPSCVRASEAAGAQ